MNQINPIIEFNTGILYPGERIAVLNPYTNAGYMINPFYYVTTFGRCFSAASGTFKEKVPYLNNDGYLTIRVSTTDGDKNMLMHRGVLATFVPVPNMYYLQVDHIDGNHTNNNLSNLRWVTSSQNNMYAHESGITAARTRVISDEDIRSIMNLANCGLSDQEISEGLRHIKISPETIRMVRTGQMIYGSILERLGLEPVVKRDHSSLTEDDYAKVINLRQQGLSSSQISEMTGIRPRTVRGIIQRASENYQKPKYRPHNPIITIPDEYQNLNMRMVNIHTSKLHTILPIYGVTPDGRMFSMSKGNKWSELRMSDKKGYSLVKLQTEDGAKHFFVHRIVLATFNPVPNMYDLEVNHLNGIHNDNRVENLAWTTHNENMQHAADNIIVKQSQRAPDEDIIKIVNYAHAGHSDEEISVLMNDEYTPHNVRIIRSGLKTYGPVLEKLNLEPFRYHHGGVAPEEREAIYQFIESRLGSKPIMDLYDDAGAEFGIAPASARKIYGKERAKRNK